MPTPPAVWQVQEAKNRLSEVIDRAQREGPQTITRHGKPVARVVAAEAGDDVAPPQSDGFFEFLMSAPKVDDFELPERRSIKPIEDLGE